MSVRQYEEPIEEATARATEPVKWPITTAKIIELHLYSGRISLAGGSPAKEFAPPFGAIGLPARS